MIALTTISAFLFHRRKPKANKGGDGLPPAFGHYKAWGYTKQHPRGIRNNNPGNLVKTSIPWQGKAQTNTDGKFEQFVSPEYGVRALIKDLISDFKKGKNTVSDLIKEFAPWYENHTHAYIRSVCDFVGVDKDVKLSLTKNTLQRLVMAIDKVENGGHYITPELFEKAYSMI